VRKDDNLSETRPPFTAERKGQVNFSKGLEGVIAGESTRSYCDGERGKLIYLGLKLEDVCDNSTFEETSCALILGRWPKKDELDSFTKMMVESREIPFKVYNFLKSVPASSHNMAVMRTAVSMLGVHDIEADDSSPSAQYRKAIRLVSKVATIAAAYGRIMKGLEPVSPASDLSHAANFLYMYNGKVPDELFEDVFDNILIIHADHESNASTFATMVTASTLSDIYSSVTSGIGTLKGPLHGGANEEVMRMLMEIGEPEKARDYVLSRLNNKQKISGFGHRVYKTYDPRAEVLKDYAAEVAKRAGTEKLFDIAMIVEKTVREKFQDRSVYPNLDFYSGMVMHSLGIETSMFTPIFVIGRMPGWTAHYLEQIEDNRLFRPRLLYVSPLNAKYVPIELR
jgi:citrate synthase